MKTNIIVIFRNTTKGTLCLRFCQMLKIVSVHENPSTNILFCKKLQNIVTSVVGMNKFSGFSLFLNINKNMFKIFFNKTF